MSEDLNTQLADLVRGRKGRASLSGCGIRLASDYVRGVLDAAGSDGAVMFPDPTGMLKEAESRLVYRNEDMGYEPPATSAPEIDRYCKAIGVDTPPRTLMVFESVLTSSREDRDGDVLFSKGAICDPAMPLLWHHILPAPVGKMLSVREQNDKHVRVASAIMESPLGLDCAALIEFGALRISHGFRPLEFRPREKGGHEHPRRPTSFEIKSFEVLEESLVTVPANTDAVITAFSRGKLHTPVVKAWAKAFHEARPAVFPAAVVGGSFTTGTIIVPMQVELTVKQQGAEALTSGSVPPVMETAQEESSESELEAVPEEKTAVETVETVENIVRPADAPEMGKPYPSEHSGRLADPGKFSKFRRENDKFGPGIDCIWGITEDGKTEVQAVRFDASRFTAEEARKWLQEHDMKPTEFEPATKPEEKAMVAIGKMTCPKCDYAGEPDGDGNCPKCGTPMEPTKPEAEKAGRVLSAANEERLRNIQATLGEILEQVAPPKADTQPAPEAQAGVPPADAAPLNRPDGSLVASAQGLLEKLFDAGNTDLAVLNRVRCAVQATIEAIEKKRRREAVAKLFSRNARPPGQHPSL